MMAINDPTHALHRGLAAIRDQFHVPAGFPADVTAAAEAAAQRRPAEHADRTFLPFVTLDPASSTDLDQAFAIERSGADLLLLYAIADIGWFVDDGGPIDAEAWRRGTTLYLPDGKAGLYPPVLSEGAASLLPDGPRPAVIFAVRISPDGEVRLDGAERALIRSRAKLAYDSVRADQLPPEFAELAARIAAADARRGAARVDPPEQEVARGEHGYSLSFRPRLPAEDRNAALSLATNLAVADLLASHGTGLFRVMDEPEEGAVRRLRYSAAAFGIAWPRDLGLRDFEKGLDARDPAQAALMMAIRRSGGGADYVPWRPGVRPWHSAMAATYAHATAPLRRLADRYVVATCLALANGLPVPVPAREAFERLPGVMARAEALSGQIERAVVDLAETVMLQDRTGEIFEAVVTDADERGARLQLCCLPVVARVRTDGVRPGDRIRVRLTGADADKRTLAFERIE